MLDLFRTLPGVLNDIENAELIREAVVFAAWRRVVGESLAEHAVPVKLDKSKLAIAVSNITWKRHLEDLCGQIIFKLNAALGSPLVTFIGLHIDETAVLRERQKAGAAAGREDEFRRQAETEISPDLILAAASIEDAEFREQFLLAAGKCLVRKKRFGMGSGL